MAIDFRIRDFAYPLSILKLKRTLDEVQWLSPEELEAYQNRRLRAIIRHACANVPYYNRLFAQHGVRPDRIRSVGDLPTVPTLGKEQIRNAGARLHARWGMRFLPRTCTTSGSTGESLRFLLDKHANTLEFVYYWRHWGWAGYRLGDSFAEISTTSFLLRPEAASAPAQWQPHLNRLLLNGTKISTRYVRDMAQALRRHRPKFLKGLASALFFFCRCLAEAGIDDLRFKAVFSTGEVLSSSYRKEITSVLQSPLLDSYGHMERTVAISQCLEGGYHVNSDYGVMELVDPIPAPDGDGTIWSAVGTSLYNKAMPLIRYQTGDMIETFKDPTPCGCGRSLPLVKAIHGRVEDVIVTPDGRYITAIFILPEFVAGIGMVQFVQETENRLTVLLVPDQEWNDVQRHKLVVVAGQLLGADMQVRIQTVRPSEIITDPSGKRRVVISHLDPRRQEDHP